MSVLKLAYRLTLYAPRSVDANEGSPLIPAAGAWHSEAFQVATIQGVSGFRPYLDMPTGDRGTVTLPEYKTVVGRFRVRLLDARQSGNSSNLTRWVTAFVGDATGAIRLKGRLVYIEESTDGGSTWNPFYVGRVSSFNLQDPLNYSIDIDDPIQELQQQIFLDRPNVSYCTFQLTLPIGLSKAFSVIPAAIPLTGIIKNYLNVAGEPYIVVDRSSVMRPDNVETETLISGYSNIDQGYFIGKCRVAVSNTTTGQSGEYWVTACFSERVGDRYAVNQVVLVPLPGDDPKYLPLSALHVGDGVTFTIYNGQQQTNDLQAPFFLGDVHPLQLCMDILDGYFGRLSNGNPVKAINYDASAFAALMNTGQYPVGRFKIEKSWKAIDFLEQAICKPYSIGFRVEPRLVGGIPKAVLVPYSTALPLTLPSSTITSDDVVAGVDVKWQPGTPITQWSVKYHNDFGTVIADERKRSNGIYDPIAAISSFENIDTVLDVSDLDSPPVTLTIDAMGVRGVLGTSLNIDLNILNQNQGYWAERTALGLLANYKQRYTTGAPLVTLECRRTSTVNSLKLGDWTLVNLDLLPNSFTHGRGGTRLFQVLKKSENGASQTLDLIDSAQNVVMTTPTVGALAAGSTLDAVLLPVTASVSAMVNVQYAVTDATTSSLASTSAAWTQLTYTGSAATASLFTINHLPSGKRIFARARLEALTTADCKIPSAWVSSSNGYLDITSLPAPSGLSITAITAKSATVNWTVGTADYPVEVLLASPSTASLQSVAKLQAGSVFYPLTGLDKNPSPIHKVAVRHVDLYGGASPMLTGSFTASGANTALPAMGPVLVYISG